MALTRPQQTQVLQSGASPSVALSAMQAAQKNFRDVAAGIEDITVTNPLVAQQAAFDRVKKQDELLLATLRDKAMSQGSQGAQDWLSGGQDAALAQLRNAAGIDQQAMLSRNDTLRNTGIGQMRTIEQGIKSSDPRASALQKRDMAVDAVNYAKNLDAKKASAVVAAHNQGLHKTVEGQQVIYHPDFADMFTVGENNEAEIAAFRNSEEDKGGAISEAYAAIQSNYSGRPTIKQLQFLVNPTVEDARFLGFKTSDLTEDAEFYAKAAKRFEVMRGLDDKAKKFSQEQQQAVELAGQGYDRQLKTFMAKQGENTLKRYYGNDIPDAVFPLIRAYKLAQAKEIDPTKGKVGSGATKKKIEVELGKKLADAENGEKLLSDVIGAQGAEQLANTPTNSVSPLGSVEELSAYRQSVVNAEPSGSSFRERSQSESKQNRLKQAFVKSRVDTLAAADPEYRALVEKSKRRGNSMRERADISSKLVAIRNGYSSQVESALDSPIAPQTAETETEVVTQNPVVPRIPRGVGSLDAAEGINNLTRFTSGNTVSGSNPENLSQTGLDYNAGAEVLNQNSIGTRSGVRSASDVKKGLMDALKYTNNPDVRLELLDQISTVEQEIKAAVDSPSNITPATVPVVDTPEFEAAVASMNTKPTAKGKEQMLKDYKEATTNEDKYSILQMWKDGVYDYSAGTGNRQDVLDNLLTGTTEDILKRLVPSS